MRSIRPLLGTLVTLVPAALFAQAGAPPAAPAWQADSLRSTALGATRRYLVATPRDYARGDGTYPVLVLLDAHDEAQWEAAVANVRFLANRGTIPPTIVVGIPNMGAQRIDEYSPFEDPEHGGGRGDAYLAFITETVKPLIDRSFRTPAWQDLVIAEAHVRDLVAAAPGRYTPEERLGFAGLTRWVESPDFHLARLGVNAVELQPVQEFDNRTRDEYHWGYMPVNYFAPASAYASDPAAASGVRELQELVRAFFSSPDLLFR